VVSEHKAWVAWSRGEDEFMGGRYSRAHAWRFDGGVEVPASASPSVVPAPWSDPAGVDPEEAFAAALSSCHMLWFLSLAARDGWRVDSYRDEASAYMGKNPQSKLVITRVVLRPEVRFVGPEPDPPVLHALHHEAHERCFLAGSVNSEMSVEPVLGPSGGT
jgi:organic hydroperoxide reductase OsmC/OhrA